MKKILIRIVVLLVLLGAAWGAYAVYKQLPQRQQQVATSKVRHGDVVIRAYSRGELRAVRSVTLVAPNLFSAVQVTKIAPLGSYAHEKDLIVEFDESERRASLEETLLEVDQTDESIKKSEADLAIRDNQDQVDLLKARYSVRRSELEVKRNPLLSEIDGKKNLLNLEEAKKRLGQLESDIQSRKEQGRAELAVLRANRNKSMIDVAREKQRIAQAKLLSPMNGLVAIRQNRSGGFFFPGMQLPDIHEGDTLQPGMPVADVLDLSELEVVARVGELDRANLHEGQEVSIELDAIATQRFRGKIKNMSGTASSNVFSGDPAKKFDVVFSIDMKQLLTSLGAPSGQISQIMATAERNAKQAPPASMPTAVAAAPPGAAPAPVAPGQNAARAPVAPAPVAPGPMAPAQNAVLMQFAAAAGKGFSEEDRSRAKLPRPPEEDSGLNVLLRPGLLADVQIIIERIPGATYVPNQAVFERDGKQIVFRQVKGRFIQQPIKIAKRSETETIIASGIEPGEVIALADPEAQKSTGDDQKKSKAMSGLPGGKK